MQKIPLTSSDRELVAAAAEAVKKPIMQICNVRAPALVAAALRLDDGQILTALNLTADVGTLGMCAEPQAIAEANRQPDRKIDTVVAVYYDAASEPKVIPPCGRCREIITDFSSSGFVILRDPGTDEVYKVRSVDLLPLKYGDYWKDGALI
jgi:cytidine deaminase